MQPKPFTSEVAGVLRRSTFTADSIDLPELDRSVYVRVKTTLEGIGGRWNRKRGTHTFRQDPATLLNEDRSAPVTGRMTFEAMQEALKAGVKVVAVPQLFTTPTIIATRMANLAGIEDGDRILEPSAGTGELIKAVARTRKEVKVVAVEINGHLVEHLRAQFMVNFEVKHGDFLEVEPKGSFDMCDRVLMNPPFERGADIKHVEHALKFLRPGGRLVAIIAGGPRQAKVFKDRASYWEELPSGTFAGTNVHSVLMVIDKG